MKNTITKIIMLVFIVCLTISGCKKASDTIPPAAVLPILTTTAVTGISGATAQSGGNITADGGNVITARGVCWNTTSGPSISNSKTTDGTGTGSFTSAIAGLNVGTTYYLRAYATNSAGTAYGNEVSLKTNATKDVYVAGAENGVAKVWKNGVATALTNGSNSGRAYSVFVSGTDIYAAGEERKIGSYYVAKVWKNGVATTLSSVSSGANSIYVSGTDVYVAGYESNGTNNVAKFWKNGVATTLSSVDSRAYSIYVSGTDVYVAGAENDVAKVWKNGVATTLSSVVSHANSIYVSGIDVYVAGDENYTIAKIWKNGVATSLTNGLGFSFAYCNSVIIK